MTHAEENISHNPHSRPKILGNSPAVSGANLERERLSEPTEKRDSSWSILQRTRKAHKEYAFNEAHDPRLPAQHWFQRSREGETLFIVFYTQACRWARCLGCNLPSLESQHHVPFNEIMAQVDHVFSLLLSEEKKRELRKIIISNNGSVLDEATFSTTALIYFVAKMNLHCPNVEVLAVETRPEYVDMAELEVISRALKEGATPTTLELAIGFEAFDDVIRNKHFQKGLTLAEFEKTVIQAAKHGFRIKAYYMLKPVPGMSEDQAIQDVHAGIAYLDDLARKHGARINIHLNPTYVATGTALEKAFQRGEFEPPMLESVRKAVLAAEGTQLSVFVGLSDEDLAAEGASFIRAGDEKLIQALEAFNRTQDFSLLKSI